MVKAQPDAPTVMIESYRKKKPRDEEDNDNRAVIVQGKQADKVKQQDYKFRSDYVDRKSAYEEALLALEQSAARRAMMSYPKG